MPSEGDVPAGGGLRRLVPRGTGGGLWAVRRCGRGRLYVAIGLIRIAGEPGIEAPGPQGTAIYGQSQMKLGDPEQVH